MSLIEQIALGESKTLELKQELPSSEQIARTILAFANTSGGKLVIGVDDQRQIIGIATDDIFALQDKITSMIFDGCHPNILPEIYTINHEDRLLLVIEAFRGNLLPYYLKKDGKNNGTYIRIGATNRRASLENIIDLERQRLNLAYDEEINYDVEFSSLDLAPLAKVFKEQDKSLDEQKLFSLKLAKEENNVLYPTNALLILLGKFEHCQVKCARFKGTTMDVFIDKKEYSGDMFSILEYTQNFILNHINLRGEISSLYRKDTYEIPPVALREALINALIHRDYTNGGRDIKVGVYDDIVNIVTPGGFPNTITASDIEAGRSEARNKVVANVFKTLGLIEQWGSGIKRIKSSCLEHGLFIPQIVESGDFVDVEIYRPLNPILSDTKKVSDSIGFNGIVSEADNHNEQEQLIINYLRSNNRITSKGVESILLVKEARARRLLMTMVSQKIISRKGSGPKTYYVLYEVSNAS
ncbi:MAG: putative DNA binding domain-containing protein [Burkholderiales bacterium]|nr:putative DNA binding domain-containing protein [Burkholderiales bacterium]